MSVTSEVVPSTGAWPAAPGKPASSFRWTHGLINRLVTLADIAAFLLTAVVTMLIAHAVGDGPHFKFTLALVSMEAAIFVLIEQSVMAYRLESYLRLSEAISWAMLALMIAWAAGGLVTLAVQPFAHHSLFWFAGLHLPQVAALGCVRIGARIAAAHVDRIGLMCRRTIIIGDGPEAEAIVHRLCEPGRSAEFSVVGVVAHAKDAESGLFAGRPLLGGLSILPTLKDRESIDLAIIAVRPSRLRELPMIFDALHWMAADVVMLVSNEFGDSLHGPREDVAGLPVLRLTQRPLKGSEAITKFIEDQVICALVLLLLGPIMLLIALLIRLDSPGPALFRQDRVGLNNRIFRIYKFRTMTVDPSDDGTKGTTDKRDQRITRIGRFLRSSSLDELPQLLNVLKGEMSIVGPRPYVAHMQVEDETFQTVVRSFAARHRIKPGITGLAQSSGFRSNALRDKSNAALSVNLDLRYIANWSVWLDLQIIVRTVLLAMSGPEVF
jgi:putative colanic acid biosynthesis UDP-glucose lipid carrier transferase